MLNLLISIVGNTYGEISAVKELIFEKNRVEVIKDFFASKINQELVYSQLKDKYVITLSRKESENKKEASEIDEIKENQKKIEKKMKVIFL